MTDTEAANTDTDHTSNEPDIPWDIVERAIRWGEGLEVERKRRDAAREEGLEKGRLQGHREVLLRFLARAGLQATPEEAQRIEACTELALLDRWIDQSVTAGTVAEALAER